MLLMVNSIRGRIILIICDIFLRKEAENRDFGSENGRLSIQGHPRLLILIGTNQKRVYTFLFNNKLSHI